MSGYSTPISIKERLKQLKERQEAEKSNTSKKSTQQKLVPKTKVPIERKPPKLFRLPEESEFTIKYKDGIWHGILRIPGEASIVGSEKSGEWLLRNLGKSWFRIQQEKGK